MSADEKLCLTELVEKAKGTIECKKTDCVSAMQKKKAWLLIAKEFNSMAGNTYRTHQQLHKAWDNIKSRRRKELSEEKKARMATGGGYYRPAKDENNLDSIINCVDIELKGAVDSDTLTLATVQSEEYLVDEQHVLQPIREDAERESVEPVLVPAMSVPCSSDAVVSSCDETTLVPKCTPKRISYTSRGSAVEKELEMRLRRTQVLQEQDAEIHALRLEEHKLRVEEQKLKIIEQTTKNKIVELQLKQAMELAKE
ncbi:hypothetical protein CBL_20217 [Carabus blaptoides fortunei]